MGKVQCVSTSEGIALFVVCPLLPSTIWHGAAGLLRAKLPTSANAPSISP